MAQAGRGDLLVRQPQLQSFDYLTYDVLLVPAFVLSRHFQQLILRDLVRIGWFTIVAGRIFPN
jgi:hypothetical protein